MLLVKEIAIKDKRSTMDSVETRTRVLTHARLISNRIFHSLSKSVLGADRITNFIEISPVKEFNGSVRKKLLGQ